MMRPLKIELDNFGPFKHETVDFERFKETPLFLITGKTGSGKTTIFDAMCYALFNETSGKKRAATQMRSDFATTKEETCVKFTFEHQGKIYQIERRPQQTLVGRGKKEVKRAAKVALTYEDQAGKAQVITKIPEAKRFIDELLKLNADQFTKVILLPQGQFRNFLAADSSEKEEVLRNLFGTELFEQWSTALKEKYKEEYGISATQKRELELLMQQSELVDENLRTEQWLELVTQKLAQQTEQLAQFQVDEAKQKRQVKQLEQELTVAKELEHQRESLAKLQSKQAELTPKKAQIQEQKKQLQRLEWAQTQKGEWTLLADAKQKIADLAKVFPKKEKEKAQLTAKLRTLTEKEEIQATQIPYFKKLELKIHELTKSLEKYQQLSELATKCEELMFKKTEKEQQNNALSTKYDELQAKLAGVTVRLDALADLNEQKLYLEHQKTKHLAEEAKYTEIKQDEKKKVEQAHELNILKQKRADAKKAKQEAEIKANELEQAYLSSQIVQLAQKLKPGHPCPVCGSSEHPHLATKTSDSFVNEEQVKAAKEKQQQTLATYEYYVSDVKNTTARLTEFKVEVTNKTTNFLAEIKCLELSQAKEFLTAQKKQLEKAEAKLKKETEEKRALLMKQQALQKELPKLEENRSELTNELQSLATNLALAKAELATKAAELPADHPTKAQAKHQLELWQTELYEFEKKQTELNAKKIKAKESVAMFTAELKQLSQEKSAVEAKQASLTQHLTQNCEAVAETLASLAELLAAKKDIAKYKMAITTFESEWQKNNSQIELLREAVIGRPKVDLTELTTSLAESKRHLEMIRENKTTLELSFKREQQLFFRVEQGFEKNKLALEHLAQLKELVDVVTGKGEQKLGLERYILQNYLTQVLDVANLRLAQLTNERYELCLSDEIGRGASSTGLELDIYDASVCKKRSVHTLSGGESFLAALALALALGEVIQQQSGGIQIDALFVDEGFGSLDQEALQTALATLQNIDGQERIVGIISHVTELKEQLPYQLQVITHGEQSTLKYRALL